MLLYLSNNFFFAFSNSDFVNTPDL